MSKLYFSYAAMNAGKSTVLLQASWNYQSAACAPCSSPRRSTPKTDEGCITSRIGINASAKLYGDADDLHAWIVREHARRRSTASSSTRRSS